MDSDSPGQPRPDRRDQRTWVARVGRRLEPAVASGVGRDVQGLTELAEEASDAARESARRAAAAAKAASLADLTVQRLGTAPLEQARATAAQIAGSAKSAANSSAAARDRAALVSHAVQSEVDRGPEQPVRRSAAKESNPQGPSRK